MRRLAGSGWGVGAKTLQIAALALVHSTAEHCAPLWCHSAHTRLIDLVINNALRIGCLRPTPADNLPIPAGIPPAELRRSGTTVSLAHHAMEPRHLVHSALTVYRLQMHGAPNRDTHLYPRTQLVSLSDNNNICVAHWEDHQRNAE